MQGADIKGSILETCGAMAGISVALVAALHALPKETIRGLVLPPNVIERVAAVLGFSAGATLLACLSIAYGCCQQAEKDRNASLLFELRLLLAGILLLGVAIVCFIRPDMAQSLLGGN